jgi:type 1 glutamine amidotransferase
MSARAAFALLSLSLVFSPVFRLNAQSNGQTGQGSVDTPLRVLVVTGGHAFQEAPFLDMFRSMHSITFERVKFGEGAEAKFKPEAAKNYDVFVFYDMNQNCSAYLSDLLAMFAAGKPGVFLHHALGSCPDDEEYTWLRGGKGRFEQQPNTTKLTWSGYKPNTSYRAHVSKDHPITAGMTDFDFVDETYSNFFVSTDDDIFLSTDQPGVGKQLGWTHRYKNSPIAYLLLGHGVPAFANQNYRTLVERSILWAAGKLPAR